MIRNFFLCCLLAAPAFGQATTQPILSEAEQLRQENASLRAQIVELEHEIAALKSGASTQPSRTPKLHQLTNGMTLQQANDALGVKGSAITTTMFGNPYTSKPPAGSFVEGWSVPSDSTVAKPGEYRAVFRNNVIDRFEFRPLTESK